MPDKEELEERITEMLDKEEKERKALTREQNNDTMKVLQ